MFIYVVVSLSHCKYVYARILHRNRTESKLTLTNQLISFSFNNNSKFEAAAPPTPRPFLHELKAQLYNKHPPSSKYGTNKYTHM